LDKPELSYKALNIASQTVVENRESANGLMLFFFTSELMKIKGQSNEILKIIEVKMSIFV